MRQVCVCGRAYMHTCVCLWGRVFGESRVLVWNTLEIPLCSLGQRSVIVTVVALVTSVA